MLFLRWVVCNRLTSVSQDFGDLNRLVGVITQGVTGTVAEKEVGKATEGGAATKDTDGQVIRVCGTCVLCSELVGMCKLMGCLFVSMCAQSMEADGNAMERGNLMEGPNEKVKVMHRLYINIVVRSDYVRCDFVLVV